MLYAIHRNQVPNYQGRQDAIIHLVSTVERVAQSGREFVFTDGHAVMAISSFFTDLKELRQIDWEIMKATYWNDTEEDGDRKRRRQAEFLVHEFFPWNLVEEIGVMNQTVGEAISSSIKKANHVPVVSVKRGWYY